MPLDVSAESEYIRERYATRWWELAVLVGVLVGGFVWRGLGDWWPTAAGLGVFGVCWEGTKWRLRRNTRVLVGAPLEQ